MNKPHLIGITGFAGSGKSSVAWSLMVEHNYCIRRFAGPLKDMLLTMGLTDAEINGSLKETPSTLLGGKTPRHAMQTLGAEWGRALIDEDLWVRVAMHHLDMMPQGALVVFDDLRFHNEAEAIRERGGEIWRVVRPGVSAGSHASEREQEDIVADYVLYNTGGVENLRTIVDTALRYRDL